MYTRFRTRLQEREEGFTLIELLVVIIIIGILAAIAIPVFLNQRQKGWQKAVDSDVRNAVVQLEGYFSDNGTYIVSAGNQSAFQDSLVASANNTVSVYAPTATTYCISGTTSNGVTLNAYVTTTSGGVVETTDLDSAGVGPTGAPATCASTNTAVATKVGS